MKQIDEIKCLRALYGEHGILFSDEELKNIMEAANKLYPNEQKIIGCLAYYLHEKINENNELEARLENGL